MVVERCHRTLTALSADTDGMTLAFLTKLSHLRFDALRWLSLNAPEGRDFGYCSTTTAKGTCLLEVLAAGLPHLSWLAMKTGSLTVPAQNFDFSHFSELSALTFETVPGNAIVDDGGVGGLAVTATTLPPTLKYLAIRLPTTATIDSWLKAAALDCGDQLDTLRILPSLVAAVERVVAAPSPQAMFSTIASFSGYVESAESNRLGLHNTS